MIDRAYDHRPVGVTIGVGNDHLMADTRYKDATPATARPVLAHAHPAGACRALWAVLIPEEAHSDPTQLIHPDFFIAWTNDHGSVVTGYLGFSKAAT